LGDIIGAMKSWWLVFTLCACGDNQELPDAPRPIDSPEPPPDANPLEHVQGTGLCLDVGCLTISADVLEYEPRFPLYADGATKRRWMQIPTGMQIDTSNMDRWVFPVGTKFWKEFTRDGTRVETRFITKTLADDDATNAWQFFTYVWNATQDANMAITAGQMDANGTPHNVPSRGQCKDCHDSLRPSRVLGFQALQLDYDAVSPLVDLEDLITAGSLTVNPTIGVSGTRFALGFNTTEKAALGYLHANCGHCHNATSTTHDIVPVQFLLELDKLTSANVTPTFTTAVNVAPDQTLIDNTTMPATNYPLIIDDGDSVASGLIFRMNTSGIKRMPKVAVETPDTAGGIAAVSLWIDSL
jgi:hypothetical protein